MLCIAVGPRDEGEVIDHDWLESLLGRLSQTLRCRKVEVKKATTKLDRFEPSSYVSQLNSVECFFSELKCDQVALHFLRSRYTWHLHLAFVEPFVMQDLFLSFRLSPDYTSVLLAVNCLLFYPL